MQTIKTVLLGIAVIRAGRALSSAVPMKEDCDLQLTLMASSLYRLVGQQIGQGYECAKPQTLFRDFIDASAAVVIAANLKLRKRQRGFSEAQINTTW